MATVSVIVLVALTIYIVAGLLALARVPDAGSPIRRLVQLALWPLAILRNVASPSRRQGRHAQVQVGPAVATATAGAGLAAPVVHASPAATAAATPMLAAAAPTALEDPAPAVASGPQAPANAAPVEPDAAEPAAAAASADPVPPPQDAVPEPPPRDLRADWERFVLRLTEPSD